MGPTAVDTRRRRRWSILAIVVVALVGSRTYAQSAAKDHVDALRALLAPCDAKHAACTTTCVTGAECEKCEKEWLDCRAKLPIDINALNVPKVTQPPTPPLPPGLPPEPPSPPPVPAKKQSDRQHEIDGCSAPDFIGGQDPCAGKLGKHGTEFGKPQGSGEAGALGPDEVVLNLPCNNHDICYQTCGSIKSECDESMYQEMLAVCKSAYPDRKCPFKGGGCQKKKLQCYQDCNDWYEERARCKRVAKIYKWGLGLFGGGAYDERQEQYCTVADVV